MSPQALRQKMANGESFLLAADGRYLGNLTLSSYHAESVSNQYGLYGSKYSTSSIWNKYGSYGSRYSSLSPFNPYTTTPPTIYFRGRKIGYLSKNQHMSNSLDPDKLREWMVNNNLKY